jgi:molybdate/tungstate transport system ATP-binding protein
MINIEKLFLKAGKFTLKNIDFNVKKGEYCVILGPTGSGKTLLMECITGLKKFNGGKIFLNGRDTIKLPPEERNIGYVPQDYALFPFLNVEKNIATGLKLQNCDEEEINKKVLAIAEKLSITHLLNRQIKGLSGGEKQRVALARALIINPDILLLDEPYSAIDSSMRKQLWWQMKELHKKTSQSIVHITHDLEEAFALSERIYIIIDGKIEQVSNRKDIFKIPENRKAAEFLGICNIAKTKVLKIQKEHLIVQCGNTKIQLPFYENIKEGMTINLGIFPCDIKVLPKTENETLNIFKGNIVALIKKGFNHSVFVKIPDCQQINSSGILEIKTFAQPDEKTAFNEGDEIKLLLPSDKIHILKN